jgi:metallo-beta-lactamase class B
MGEVMNLSKVISVLLFLSFSTVALAQAPVSPPAEHPDKTELVEPFNIIDNIYFVGRYVQEGSYLVTGSEGHLLIDTGYDESVPIIVENVRKLGFNPDDIKYIMGAHAHSDHVDGHARMQEMTGASILSSAPDVEVTENGGATDFRPGEWRPSKVDRVIEDGEVISLGDTNITVHYTPGHTRGAVSFTMNAVEDGQNYNVLLMGGVRIAARPVFGHPQYPNMATDFASTFEKLKKMPVDVYLGSHGYWYGLGDKKKRMEAGEGFRAFIDPEGFKRAIDGWQQQFIDQVVSEGMELVN